MDDCYDIQIDSKMNIINIFVDNRLSYESSAISLLQCLQYILFTYYFTRTFLVEPLFI